MTSAAMQKRPTTDSELAFQAYLEEHGFDNPDFQPPVLGKTKFIDFRVWSGVMPLFFEVKEFEGKEVKARIANGAGDPYKSIYGKIENAMPQIAQYEDFCCSLVLYAKDSLCVHLDARTVIGGFLGPLSLSLLTDQASGKTSERLFWDAKQGGYARDPETIEARNTYLSSVILLEEFPAGRWLFWLEWDREADKLV
jgi:hypothetical protein